jgi:hypothetical protein
MHSSLVMSRALAGLSFAVGRSTRGAVDSRSRVRRGSCTGVQYLPAFRYPRIQRTSLTWPARLGLLSGLAGSTPGIWSTLRSVVPVRGWIGVFRRSSPLVGSRTLEPRSPGHFRRVALAPESVAPTRLGRARRAEVAGSVRLLGLSSASELLPESGHLHAMLARADPALGFASFGTCGHRPVRLARRGLSIAIGPNHRSLETASGSYPLLGLRGRD